MQLPAAANRPLQHPADDARHDEQADERRDQNNTVTAFIQHEYSRIQSLRVPKLDE